MTSYEADDYGHETAEDVEAAQMGLDPFCEWCGDTGYRWTLGPNFEARYEHCDRCFGGDE